MGQSLVKNYIHIVFSTKYHHPFIKSTIESELHSYLAGVCNNLECQVLKIGGYSNHVHILCMLSKKIALMHLVEKLKSQSSKWIKTKGTEFKNFYWQNGYGGFSVTPNEVDGLIIYISNQHNHHHRVTFQEEFRTLLETFNIEFDERYIWD